ncbi:MAG: nucleotidyltransferase family protein [Chloroflexi bacterium]|nr:nucleotidyltransferase family protein [Chloroflexota bacterium]
MNLEEILHTKREEILRIATRHGAYNVRIFGSVARGEESPESDLLVEMAPDHSPWFPAGLILELEDLLGQQVDVVTENGLHWYLRDRILAEAVPL